MKKSLTLDTQSSAKRFEKRKIIKTIKTQPSHFTESAKACKFENLDSLSEMFTIQQPVVSQHVQVAVPQDHVTAENSDDWSDFSGATEIVFQEQNSSTRLAVPPLEQTLSSSSFSNLASGQVVPSSDQGLPTALSSTFKWESGNVIGDTRLSHGNTGQGMVGGNGLGKFQCEGLGISALPSAVQNQGWL